MIEIGERLARWLYHRLERMPRKPDRLLYNSAVREDLQTLEPAGDTAVRQREYVIKKLSLCSMIVVCGVVLSVILWIKDGMETKIVENQIPRNAFGNGAKQVSLVAEDGRERYDIPVTVSERSYSNEELTQMSVEALPVLEAGILGENQSLDRIEYDMHLMDRVFGYPFTVEWRTDDTYMDYTGKLVRSTLEAPVIMNLTAILSCESFETEYDISVRIYSKAVQPNIVEQLESQVSDAEAQSRSAFNMTLPSEIENRQLQWRYKRRCRGILFLAATPLLTFLIYYGKDKDLHRQVEEREEQMRMDYPEIVSALALLIGAGMTVPNAWNKIAKDYRQRREESGGKRNAKRNAKRYAYEEMLLTVYEMESGVTQTMAYERFGRRCRIPRYNKLAAMLSQNIRKGAANLPLLLKEEAADAFEERKHSARKQGEKAGTKLLVPMMMLLGITMVIIMVPALQTYF
ncbi:MAG: type II secretion system F family protein [Lachnospiraceae bacterium]|nr:type II secretion system F family protein [Lachnospiraceae bacterium]